MNRRSTFACGFAERTTVIRIGVACDVTKGKQNGAASCLVRRTEICTWELCSELLQQEMYDHKDKASMFYRF
ncbi:hypothetical protein MHI37_28540 [Paenibacillus sp. FSL H8-0548]|uniref:hypothetical protein n=1 Tax=Paenibacillus sp. FSL H8-0548 TaxID=1920422 RepID=UPI0011806669|nr:hypothetical protein [Paenibacillus sp. FSL H8-0548]